MVAISQSRQRRRPIQSSKRTAADTANNSPARPASSTIPGTSMFMYQEIDGTREPKARFISTAPSLVDRHVHFPRSHHSPYRPSPQTERSISESKRPGPPHPSNIPPVPPTQLRSHLQPRKSRGHRKTAPGRLGFRLDHRYSGARSVIAVRRPRHTSEMGAQIEVLPVAAFVCDLGCTCNTEVLHSTLEF